MEKSLGTASLTRCLAEDSDLEMSALNRRVPTRYVRVRGAMIALSDNSPAAGPCKHRREVLMACWPEELRHSRCAHGKIRFFSPLTGHLLGKLVIPGADFKAGSPSAAVLEGKLLFSRYRNTMVCESLDTRTICWQNSHLPYTPSAPSTFE